ncbi:MAG: class I SAM-dependent methyltransferase [Dehalococcoidales bacterium]|nr:class I SAM-dependent methyltransferase [Dehalococcoidales bacterium]
MASHKIARKILLVPIVKRSFAVIVDFYNNLPVFPDQPEFKVDTKAQKQPVFHVGSVMPFSDKDAIALQKVVTLAHKEKMLAAEVGSWTGRSTSVLGASVNQYNGNVYAIDHWQGSIDVWQYDITKSYDVFSIFRHNMEALGLSNIVHPMVMDSLTASKIFKDESLDLVFIDADHRYTPVKNDILAWLPKVKKGGIVSGHDCSGYYSKYPEETKLIIDSNRENDDLQGIGHPGVIKALFDCFQDKHSIMLDSVVWYYQK